MFKKFSGFNSRFKRPENEKNIQDGQSLQDIKKAGKRISFPE